MSERIHPRELSQAELDEYLDNELINLGVCIKNQADRIAEAAIAARREAVRLMTAGAETRSHDA